MKRNEMKMDEVKMRGWIIQMVILKRKEKGKRKENLAGVGCQVS